MSFKETSEICENLKKINFILRKDENLFFEAYDNGFNFIIRL